MDTSDYLPMFLAESQEHLQALNLAVVRIEEEPGDTETIEEIFRIAHSLKGMSATMGFARIAALTHAMEDVFELLRQRRGGLEREAVDVLLECLDALGDAFAAIESTGEEALQEQPLVHRLESLVRERTPEQELERVVGDLEPAELAERAHGRRIVHVAVQLAEQTLMPSVRAYQVLTALGDHGELLASVPTHDAVEQFDGRAVEAWVATEHEEAAIAASVLALPDVAAAEARESTDEAATAQAATAIGGAVAHARPAAAATRTVRVDAERLDQLMHLMGELVVHRTQVESLVASADVPGLQQAIQDLTRSSQALQAMVMQVRMIPVEAVFLRFPRLVRDLSSKLGKTVELRLSGNETELDRTVVDALGDPLVHLVRNALDHGFEPPADREAAGKPATGVLEISARHAGGNVLISVRDDGRGVDPANVARKAAARGLIPEDAVASVDMQRAIELLFTAGFSTSDETSDVSGRGVGMDAVRATIRELGGEVVIQSETGAGTTAQIRLPLTLAIVAALLVESGGMPFAIQLDRVESTLRLEDHPIRSAAGRSMLLLRDGVLPLLDLSGALGFEQAPASGYAVVVRGAERRLALAVEHLVGQRELVTRPLPPELGDRSSLTGGAVLANGEIALIVDCDALASAADTTTSMPTAA